VVTWAGWGASGRARELELSCASAFERAKAKNTNNIEPAITNSFGWGIPGKMHLLQLWPLLANSDAGARTDRQGENLLLGAGDLFCACIPLAAVSQHRRDRLGWKAGGGCQQQVFAMMADYPGAVLCI